MELPLPTTIDTAAAGPLRQTLRAAIEADGPVVLDGSGVDSIGQAGLQVLLAAKYACSRAGVLFRLDHPSDALTAIVARAGLSCVLKS